MLSKQQVREVQDKAIEALKQVFGDKVALAGGSFSETDATLKFQFQLGSSEDRTEVLRHSFNRNAEIWGLRASDFDLPLIVDGMAAKLIAIEAHRPKNPFVLQTSDGRRWKGRPDHFLIARSRRVLADRAA